MNKIWKSFMKPCFGSRHSWLKCIIFLLNPCSRTDVPFYKAVLIITGSIELYINLLANL